MPIQRLPRYEMLLSDLLKYTEENVADYNLIKQSLNKVKETTSFLNNLKRAEDSKLRLSAIEKKVIGSKVRKGYFRGLIESSQKQGLSRKGELLLERESWFIFMEMGGKPSYTCFCSSRWLGKCWE